MSFAQSILSRDFSREVYKLSHRNVHTSQVAAKVVPNNLKGKSTSSRDWLTRQLNDPYVKMARYQNYRARSAFKLIEIDDKFRFLKPGMTVVECGAAPGAWTQVLVQRLRLAPEKGEEHLRVLTGQVIAIDINPMSDVEGAMVLSNTDFTKPINQGRILSLLNGEEVDLVTSDMAPNATGLKPLDHEAITTLAFSALRFAIPVLKPNTGAFLTKLWDGTCSKDLQTMLEKFFESVSTVKPPSSRVDSAETFYLATGYRGIAK